MPEIRKHRIYELLEDGSLRHMLEDEHNGLEITLITARTLRERNGDKYIVTEEAEVELGGVCPAHGNYVKVCTQCPAPATTSPAATADPS